MYLKYALFLSTNLFWKIVSGGMKEEDLDSSQVSFAELNQIQPKLNFNCLLLGKYRFNRHRTDGSH